MNSDIKEAMNKSIDALKDKFSKVRAGRASLDILKDVRVEYYGDLVPVNQVATLSIANARTIEIEPWERNMIPVITRAIQHSDLGINPQSYDKGVRLVLPPLTEERRKEFVKKVKHDLEEAKVSLRNIRHKFNNEIKNGDYTEDERRAKEKEVQKHLDEFVAIADKLFKEKEQAILKV